MISEVSRYSTGYYGQITDPRTLDTNTYLFRRQNSVGEKSYYEYIFKQGDRIDMLSHVFLNDAKYWYLIMDLNPNIIDPFNIAPGTVVKIPVV